MEAITVDTHHRLEFRVRSPLQNTMGVVGVALLVWLVAHWLFHSPNMNRLIGLAGGSAVCFLFALLSESADFVFDATTRHVTWTRRFGIVRRGGDVPFREIEQVVVRSALGSSNVFPHQRICLLTRRGELPLTRSYSPRKQHAEHAERLRVFLGLHGSDSTTTSVEEHVAAGRDLDAIRELRLARGMSLEEARAEVFRVRAKIGADAPVAGRGESA